MIFLVVSRGLPSKENPLLGIFEWDQARALKNAGHEVVFLAMDLRSIRRKRKFGFSKSIVDGITVYNYSFPVGRVPRFIMDFISWHIYNKMLKKILREHKIDIVHYHFGMSAISKAIKAKEKYNLKYIVTEHDSRVNNNLVSMNEANKLKEVYHNAEARIAVSIAFKQKLEALYDEEFVYIPNIVDLNAMSDVNKIPHKEFTFISVGNLIKGKAMDVTIEGFEKIHVKYPDTQLYIVGDGEERHYLEKLISDKKLNGCVRLTGRLSRDEIKKYFDISDCFVLMSRSETFGVAYIEAMACGLPVIATKCGGPESFVNDSNGILVDIDNVNELVQAMEYVMINKYDSYSIRQYCVDNFSEHVVADKITLLLENNGRSIETR